jgi:hypothetical protein
LAYDNVIGLVALPLPAIVMTISPNVSVMCPALSVDIWLPFESVYVAELLVALADCRILVPFAAATDQAPPWPDKVKPELSIATDENEFHGDGEFVDVPLCVQIVSLQVVLAAPLK